MKALKFVAVGVALLAGVGAVAVVQNELQKARDTAAPVQVAPPPPPIVERQTAEVLVTSRPLRIGEPVAAADLRWQPWPAEAVNDAFMLRESRPDAIEEWSGSVTRAALLEGEPVAPGKLVKLGEAGVLSAMIRDGLRGYALTIAPETGVGGFALPGDFVDVILAQEIEVERRLSDGSMKEGTVVVSQTLIETARVLAVDTEMDADGDASIDVRRTVTLEIAPQHAEVLAMAERIGRITLSLRGLATLVDENGPRRDVRPVLVADASVLGGDLGGPAVRAISVVRAGARSQAVLP